MRSTLVAVAGIGLVLFACGAPEIPDDLASADSTPLPDRTKQTQGATIEAGASSGGDDAPPPAHPADAGAQKSSGDAGDAGAPATGACAGETTQDTCYKCCERQAPGAIDELDKVFADCMCAQDTCGYDCAQSACAGYDPQPGDACDQCLTNYQDACDLVAVTACKQDASCAKLFACDDASQCANKPKK